MAKETEKFWMVYVEGRNVPRWRYSTLKDAAAEAERLAAENDIPVYLLRVINVCQRLPVQIVWQELG